MKKEMEMVRLARATQLFRDLKDAEIADLLVRLNAVKKSYRKGETVMHAGLKADRLMVIASGCLHVYEHEENSRQVLVRTICQGSVLGLWILHVPEILQWLTRCMNTLLKNAGWQAITYRQEALAQI